jgi:dipeptidase
MYGIMNEKQVGMGESTCASKLYAAPVGPSGGGKGRALFDISELSQVALERSSSAREAIQVGVCMGGGGFLFHRHVV